MFWLIVLAYQFAAFDSLQNWQLSRSAWDYVGRFRKQAEGAKSDPLKRLQAGTAAELDARLPAMLDGFIYEVR